MKTNSRLVIEKISPNLYPDYTIIELSSKNVPKRPSIAKLESKIDGERLFFRILCSAGASLVGPG